MSTSASIKKSYKPQNCPPGNVLYRITFKYKTNFSGNALFNLTRKNFPDFSIDVPDRKLRPGDYIRYTPRNKNDPNNGKIAVITVENNKRYYGKIVKLYDLEFISPNVKNNQVINNVESIPQEKDGVKIITLIPQLSVYKCSAPFIPMNILKNYLQAYKSYNSRNTNKLLRDLEKKGSQLFDNYFKLGNNNEPLYPEFVAKGQSGHGLQKRMKNKVNKEVQKIVNNSFLSNTKSFKPIIKGTGENKKLEFSLPKDAKGGKLVTVNVNGISVNVNVPIGSKSLDRITVPIERRYNQQNYDNLNSGTSKKESKLTFFPTFIIAKFTDDKHLDIQKLVSPSKGQLFKIIDASIIRQKDGLNFKFTELPRFNKKNNPLVFDLEVHVDLRLEVTKDIEPESSGKYMNKLGTLIQNSGSGCPSRMRKLKNHISNLSKQIEKKRYSRGNRISKSLKKTHMERKIGEKKKTEKLRKITRNKFKGKKRTYGGKKTRRKKKKKKKTKKRKY